MKPLLRIFLLIISCHYLAACSLYSSYLKPAKNTLEQTPFYTQAGNHKAIILLPGLGMTIKEFEQQGLVDLIKQCNPSIDIIAADLYLAYYRQRSVLDRLHQDVILPLQLRGYRQISLLGISLGSLGALRYRSAYPEQLYRVLVMAPYLGEQDELEAFIRQQTNSDIEPNFIELWQNLRATGKQKPPIYAAYGNQDRFHFQHQWLSQQLPEASSINVDGVHKWRSWAALWQPLLDASGLCQSH